MRGSRDAGAACLITALFRPIRPPGSCRGVTARMPRMRRSHASRADGSAVTIGSGFADVLTAAKAGGEWAWERLFASVAAQVRGYLAAQGASDPDNVTGEVLLGLVSGVNDFEGDESAFRSWVFVMAHHRLVDERRRDRRRMNMTNLSPSPEPVAGADTDVLERLGGSEWRERLAKLSDDQRSVVLLRVIAGLSTEQTAEVLGKRPGTVRVLQHRALGRLREILLADVTQ